MASKKQVQCEGQACRTIGSLMSGSVLKEIDKLSLWDISHYWHGANPQKTSPSRLPLEVQKTMRALALKASKGLYLICRPNSFVFNRLVDPEDQFTISVVKRLYKREFEYAIKGTKYKRNFLSNISMGRKGILIWCKRNKVTPPNFWFDEDDPLLSKTIQELDNSLSPEQMQTYGYVALFETANLNESLKTDFQFSSDVDTGVDKPDFKKKNSIIEEAISEGNRANAKARYIELDKIKVNFVKFYSENKTNFKSKAAVATAFFELLTFAEKVLVVPSYDEKDKKDGIEKAIRNLLKVIKK